MQTQTLFPWGLDISFNVLPSPLYVLVIVHILESCEPVCDLNLILFPNLWLIALETKQCGAVLHDVLKVSCPYQESGVLMYSMVGLFGLHRCLGRIGQLVKFVEQINCKAGSRFAVHKISHHCWSPNVDCPKEYCFRDLTPRSLVAISRLRGVLAQKTVCLHS